MEQSLDPTKMKPALKLWTSGQYQEGGPFFKWLKDVKACTSRSKCCPGSGRSNVVIRDFPTNTFAARVVQKNYLTPDGDELECERAEIAKELQAIKDEEERIRKQKEEEDRIKKENERIAAEKAKKEEEEKKKEELKKEKEYIAVTGQFSSSLTLINSSV